MTRKRSSGNNKDLAAAARILKKGKVVFLSGAGMSRESGIPTFRGRGGLWEKYDPAIYANLAGLVSVLREDPPKLVGFISDFYGVLLNSRPNPGHLSLSYLEKSGLVKTVITQNVDDLHQQAGTRSVLELHGNAFRIRCQGCGQTLKLEKERVKEMVSLMDKAKVSSRRLQGIFGRYCPRCVKCKGRFRIDIVFFGEELDDYVLASACKALEDCRAMIVVGSSLSVYPAAGLPLYARERGARIIEINPEPSALSDSSDYKIFGAAAEILPELVKATGV